MEPRECPPRPLSKTRRPSLDFGSTHPSLKDECLRFAHAFIGNHAKYLFESEQAPVAKAGEFLRIEIANILPGSFATRDLCWRVRSLALCPSPCLTAPW
jgi:hypothetical protein